MGEAIHLSASCCGRLGALENGVYFVIFWIIGTGKMMVMQTSLGLGHLGIMKIQL